LPDKFFGLQRPQINYGQTDMNTADKVTEQVKQLYEDSGWTMVGDATFDAESSEDLRQATRAYVSACRLRVLRHLPTLGRRLLDMASGPVQYPEYLSYSEGFATRVCVDLSQRALDMAKSRLGARGEYHVGDFLDLEIAPVDAAVSLHTIYHIHKDRQEAAVRKLIALTQAGGSIVIVYSNPAYLVSAVLSPLRRLGRRAFRRAPSGDTPDTIYFYRYPLKWWYRFRDSGAVTIYPWRTFSTREQKALIPNNRLGTRMLSTLFVLEEKFPRVFAAIGCYPMIVIRKS
jgi:SAM-dependent methyltransferase